jgi:preprotein translocase subunit YajC
MKKSAIAALVLGTVTVPFAASAQQTGSTTQQPTASAQTGATTQPAAGAPAPSSPNLSVGAKVFGPAGDQVGTVESISGDNVVVNTGNVRATLARSSFGSGANGPTVGIGKADLEAAVQKAQTQASAATANALTPGAEVKSKDGQPVGKIAKVEGDNVVLDRPSGAVTLSKSQLASDPQQGLMLAMTAAEFEAAAKSATASAGATKGTAKGKADASTTG